MSRNKPYQNRLEELFSSTEPVPPEPVKTIPPAEATVRTLIRGQRHSPIERTGGTLITNQLTGGR